MSDSPFVGRETELEKLTESIRSDSQASLLPVVGPTGIGKSTLFTQFVEQCRDRDYRALRYDLKEPNSVDQFLSRLLNHWRDIHPGVVPSRRGTLQDITGNVGRSLSQTPGLGTSILGALLNSFGGEGGDEVLDITSELLELAVKTRDMSPENQFVLVIDQFDGTRIDEAVFEEIAHIRREIASYAPRGVVCCVGTRERFYRKTDPEVSELELQPFSVDDVQTYLNARNMDTTVADRVHDAASGSPYFVERIGQVAAKRGSLASVLADLSEVESERRQVLEEHFLSTLDEFPQRLLRETCFLSELRPRPVAHILDADILKVEDTLRDLERRSILTQVGSNKGKPVYRLHGLQRDFLRERISDKEKVKQHARAAGYFAVELANRRTGSSKELLTKKGVEQIREYMTSGIMFEYHLQQLPPYLDIEERVERIFESVPNQDPSPREAALNYFRGYREYAITPEDLGVTSAVDAKNIQTALDDRSKSTEIVGASPEAVVRGLQAENTLNDDQTEIVLLVGDAAVHVAQASDSGVDKEKVVEQLTTRRERLTSEEYPNAPELYKFGRVAIDLLRDVMAEESGDDDVWKMIKHEYDVTRDDYRVLSKAVIKTGRYLFDWSVTEEIIEERDGRAVATGQLKEEASIEEDGIEGSLLKNLRSPLFTGYRALQSPTTEQLDELSDMWSELETQFEDDSKLLLAAFCRDIRETLIDPITGDATKARVGLELMNATNLEDLYVLNHEPVATLATVMKTLNGVAEHDPEQRQD